MVELLRTNNAVMLSYATALLAAEGLECLVFDQHASIIEGSIGAIQRRLMVAVEDAPKARRLLAQAGIEVRPEAGA